MRVDRIFQINKKYNQNVNLYEERNKLLIEKDDLFLLFS